MDGQHPHSGELKRGLKNRHIQLIALGGAIGTGLFLGSAGVLKSAGPSMILGYAIAGFIAFMIMRQLGEMIVEEPVAGSFSHFAHKYWGGFAGFLSGWNCWVLYILVGMSELTAVGKYIHYWWPEVPTWATAALFFVVVNAINLANVKAFGEAEFWFAIIKVVAIIGMILLGCYLLFSGSGGPQASVSNLWAHGGFFPNGVSGLVMARGVPVRALVVSALVTFLAVGVNYVIPHQALELLMSLVVAALVINWAMISMAHLKFRAQMDRQGTRTHFRAFWYPYGNYLCMAFVVFILGVMLLIPGIQVSVYAIPVWLLVMWACYRLKGAPRPMPGLRVKPVTE